jgi:hypothetical protein
MSVVEDRVDDFAGDFADHETALGVLGGVDDDDFVLG